MDIFFQDPSEVPLPPEEVRIRELRADPWPDQQRVNVYLEVDPFQKRPNAHVFIQNEQGEEIAQASLIEPMTRKMEFTMHLRHGPPPGEYLIEAVLFYTDPLPLPDSSGESLPVELPEPHIIDRAQSSFQISRVES